MLNNRKPQVILGFFLLLNKNIYMKHINQYITEAINNNSKKTILYIHGLGSNKNSSTYKYIKEYFSEYNVISYTFDLTNPKQCLNDINTKISKKQPDIVIASSLGAFFGLISDFDKTTIVINPCMNPAYEIPKLTELKDNQIHEFEQLSIKLRKKSNVHGIFGDNDELFSYKPEFNKLYSDSMTVSGGHRLSKNVLLSSLEYMLKKIEQKL